MCNESLTGCFHGDHSSRTLLLISLNTRKPLVFLTDLCALFGTSGRNEPTREESCWWTQKEAGTHHVSRRTKLGASYQSRHEKRHPVNLDTKNECPRNDRLQGRQEGPRSPAWGVGGAGLIPAGRVALQLRRALLPKLRTRTDCPRSHSLLNFVPMMC